MAKVEETTNAHPHKHKVYSFVFYFRLYVRILFSGTQTLSVSGAVANGKSQICCVERIQNWKLSLEGMPFQLIAPNVHSLLYIQWFDWTHERRQNLICTIVPWTYVRVKSKLNSLIDIQMATVPFLQMHLHIRFTFKHTWKENKQPMDFPAQWPTVNCPNVKIASQHCDWLLFRIVPKK